MQCRLSYASQPNIFKRPLGNHNRFAQPLGSNFLQFFQGIPSELQIKLFDFRSRPRGFPQELQAGLYARVIIKASYIDDLPHFLPSMMLHQLSKHYFQRDTVKRIFMLLFAHGPLFFNARGPLHCEVQQPLVGRLTPTGRRPGAHGVTH